ncbi:MAG: hypothetical protein U0269_03050 [Polyangiales bacterium]
MTQATVPHRVTALALGAALLAQCLLAPLLLARTERAAVVVIGAIVGAAALFWAIPRVGERDRLPAFVALAGVPTLLALTSLASSTLPHFDGAARVLAALTAVGYFAAVLRLREAAAPRLAIVTRRSTDAARSTPAPVLRWHAWIVLVSGALVLALLAPARLAARPLTGAERALGPGFLTARNAIVSAAGMLLALVWTLGAGPRLVRGRGSPYGRRARAIAMVVWSFAFGALWWWVERAR